MITREQTLAAYADRYRDHPRIGLALRLIAGAGVAERRLAAPIERLLGHPAPDVRHRHREQAEALLPRVIRQALEHARLGLGDIDVLVHTCDDGDPAAEAALLAERMDAWADLPRLSIRRPGGTAGAAAINLAYGFCAAHPGANALVVACSFGSPRPASADPDVRDLLAGALRGHGVAAAVVRGHGGTGVEPRYQSSVRRTRPPHRVGRDIGATAAHPRPGRRATPDGPAAVIARQARGHGWDPADLDLCVIHPGAPAGLGELASRLRLAPAAIRATRETLGEYGDIGGAVVLDALRRAFDAGTVRDGARCLLAGFGPGAAAELMLGTWVEHAAAGPRPAHAPARPARIPGGSGRYAGRDRVRACARYAPRAGGVPPAGGRGACCDAGGPPRRRHRPKR